MGSKKENSVGGEVREIRGFGLQIVQGLVNISWGWFCPFLIITAAEECSVCVGGWWWWWW